MVVKWHLFLATHDFPLMTPPSHKVFTCTQALNHKCPATKASPSITHSQMKQILPLLGIDNRCLSPAVVSESYILAPPLRYHKTIKSLESASPIHNNTTSYLKPIKHSSSPLPTTLIWSAYRHQTNSQPPPHAQIHTIAWLHVSRSIKPHLQLYIFSTSIPLWYPIHCTVLHEFVFILSFPCQCNACVRGRSRSRVDRDGSTKIHHVYTAVGTN